MMSARKLILSGALRLSADRFDVFSDWFDEHGEKDMAKLARYWAKDTREALERADLKKQGKLN